MSWRICLRQSSFTSSSAPKNIFPCRATSAMYLSTFIPTSTRALFMLSRNGLSVKYPDARRNPTTASRFFIAQYAFKFAHERIAVLVGEYMRMHDLVHYPPCLYCFNFILPVLLTILVACSGATFYLANTGHIAGHIY